MDFLFLFEVVGDFMVIYVVGWGCGWFNCVKVIGNE